MNELIKIEVRDNQQLVSGRELHKFLEVGTEYMKWFSRIIEKYNFIENKDFTVIVKNDEDDTAFGGIRKSTDHLMTLNMAKEIAMVSNTEKGKEARIYFIKCEEAWNSPEMILARANQIQSHMIEDYTKKIELLENKVKEDKPKVLFAESVATSKTSILVGDLAKIIKQNGVDIGQKRLFTWLRDNEFLIKRLGTDYNMPTQKSMELELFEIKETAVTHADGHTTINKTPKVTGKGQIYFINKFKEA